MFSKIVVGIDGSQTSENAVRLACDLAQKYASELHLVHTPQPQTVAFAMGAVAGYHAVTTMPSEQEVQDAGIRSWTQAKRSQPSLAFRSHRHTCNSEIQPMRLLHVQKNVVPI